MGNQNHLYIYLIHLYPEHFSGKYSPLFVETENIDLWILLHIPIAPLLVNQSCYETPYLTTDNSLLPVAGNTNRIISFCKDG